MLPAIVDRVVRSSGEPLDPGVQSFMESRFCCDLGHVRIHTDSKAALSAEAVRAKAYALGPHIAFGAGHYQPHTDAGRRLLAHELTHVIQQRDRAAHGLQRKPVETWGGSFTPDTYEVRSDPAKDAYGAHIHITFSPSDAVEAEKIAFVQTAQSLASDPANPQATLEQSIKGLLRTWQRKERRKSSTAG